MLLPALSSHRLVGGTALALQIGHRISVDIDLFSDSASDYAQVEQQILGEFGADAQVVHYLQSTLGKGISMIINGVKTDILDWNKSFQFDTAKMDGIRLANLPQIAAMKLDIITSPPEYVRYEKKGLCRHSFFAGSLQSYGTNYVFQATKSPIGLSGQVGARSFAVGRIS